MDTEEINILEKFNKSVEKLIVKICKALQPVVDSLLEILRDKTIDADLRVVMTLEEVLERMNKDLELYE